MLHRRLLFASLAATVGTRSLTRPAQAADYQAFLAGIRTQALAQGIAPGLIRRALAQTRQPNPNVLKLDRHQPEFTLTWAQYRERVLPDSRLAAGREAYAQFQPLMSSISARFGCDNRAVVGIWGIESGFGAHQGTFSVIDALATLAYDGRRSAYFRGELLKALHILNQGDTQPETMLGGYAGAMGQPQFMPSAFLRYAADGDGDGRRNIWTSQADVFASISNYLGRSGWHASEPWGQEVTMIESLSSAEMGRTNVRSLGQWMMRGVRRVDGEPFSRPEIRGALLQPDGPGTQAFMVYHNFNVIRRYNPSDFYALAVGLLGTSIAAAG